MADTEEPDLLVSPADIQAGIPEPLPAELLKTIAANVSDAVRRHCGWRVAPAADQTFTRDARGTDVLSLPTLHINTVSSVTERGVALTVDTEYDWSEHGIMQRLRHYWPHKRRGVVVVLNHGYASCPGDIALAITAAVARGILAPASGATGETTLGAAVQFSRQTSGAAAGAIFLPHEIAVLDRYRIMRTG